MNNPETYTFSEFNLERNVHTGSRLLEDRILWKVGEKYEKQIVTRSIAVLKVIDEVVTNAVDASVGAGIEITFNGLEISVKNHGRFIAFEKIQAAFSEQFTSSNYSKDTKSTTGGLNGVGAKLTNVLSKIFYVEVSSGEKVYRQTFKNNLSEIGKASISDEKCGSYVFIKFVLDFDRLCQTDIGVFSENWLAKNKTLVGDLVLRRVHEVAVYVNDKVLYNGKLVKISFSDFVKRHSSNPLDIITMTEIGKEFVFKVGIIIREPVQKKTKYIPAGHEHITIINGVVLEEKNNLTSTIIKKVTQFVKSHKDFKNYVRKEIKGTFPLSLYQDNVIVIIVGRYPRMEFEYKSQEKSAINFSANALKRFEAEYNFSPEFLDSQWRALKKIYPKIIEVKNKNKKDIAPLMYEPAMCIKRSQGNMLFVAEGISAATLLRQLITGSKELGFETNGIFCLKGVPINSIKNSKLYPAGPLMEEKLENNNEIQSLVNVMGLVYGRDLAGKYKNIVLSTDQDSDGIGKICSLMICFFMLYFPYIIKQGRLWRYRTPIVRALDGRVKRNFYSEQEFRLAYDKNPKLKGDYYKGLGTHEVSDIKEMIKTFKADLVRINYDEEGEKLMHVLYGRCTINRKIELMKFDEKVLRLYKNDLSVLMVEHFNNESKAEQVGNILRMVPNTIDGLVPCQRKILAYLKANKTKCLKKTVVCSLAGSVKGEMNYNHGQESLEGTIKLMAQVFDGACVFPIILPVSAGNGNRNFGSKGTTAARYTKVCYNPFIDYYFPPEDDGLFELREEEGEYYEPINYVPIVPRVLTEHIKSVATGWNSNFAARPFSTVVKYVEYSIETWPFIVCPTLFGQIQSNSEIITAAGKEIGIGVHEVKGNTIYIKDLPPRLYAEKFKKHLKMKFIEDVFNHSSGNKIDIIINVKPGFFEEAKSEHKKPYLDPVVEYLGLYKIYPRNLNFYEKTRLREYSTVSDVFRVWFEERRLIYEKRRDKKLVLLEARWKLRESIYHFLKTDKGAIEGKRLREQLEMLKKSTVVFTNNERLSGYLPMNREKISIDFPGDAEALRKAIYENGTYDYIMLLNKKQTSIEYAEKYVQKVAAALNEYTEYLKTNWQSLWLADLNKLKKCYEFGTACNWDYEKILEFDKSSRCFSITN